MDTFPSIVTVKSKEKIEKEKSCNSETNEQCPSEAKAKQRKHESFHEAVGPVLLFGQLFAMLPVDGVLSKSEDELNFRWRSPRTIYALIFLFCGTIETIVGTRRLVRLGFNIHFAESFLFFITAMMRSFFIFRLGMRWKEIMRKWRQLEEVFLNEPYKVKGLRLSTKVRVVFGILMTFVLIEHLFFLVKALEDNRLQLEYCTPKSTDFWQNFLWRYRPHLIYNFPYSIFELPLYEWINLLQAFSWSYSDIFIVVLAIGLRFRFQQFNQYFDAITDDVKKMTEDNFRILRDDYYKLIDLVQYIDSNVSMFILVSLGHNMLVLMVKIYSALNPNRYHYLDDIYFWFYLLFLITRIFVTLMACAGINEVSRNTINFIRRVPSHFWTIDLKRLFDTISIEVSTLTFSGNNFFYITKTMMLAFVGAIVTFELVLLDKVKEEEATLCSVIDY